MNSPNPHPQRTVGLRKNPRMPAAVTVPQQNHAGNAANDDAAATDLDHNKNPLWILVIALGVFCAVAALVMAFD
jgi:hypothetical protein